MKISMTCAGYCFNNGKPDQRAGCAVLLDYSDDYDRTADRVICQPVGGSTKPRAEIMAATYGLMSISRKKFRKSCEVVLHVPQYIAGLLETVEDGNYKSSPKKNPDEVAELRLWVSYFDNLRAVAASKEDLTRCLNLAKECADTQKASDTGTRVTV